MKILVTNDDGIHSPGLWAAVEALATAGQVFAVAPDREQSGVGASLTLHSPVRASRLSSTYLGGLPGVEVYAVEGTPGDSCVLALENLVGPVDLVVSGINRGSNLGEDVLISGTVGAALQGYIRGYPSIAISVAAVKDTRYDVATALLRLLGEKLAAGATLPSCLINVNVPNEPLERVRGVRITRMGTRSYIETVTEGDDGRRKYYWITRAQRAVGEQPEDTDISAVLHGSISVTPIHTRLTDTSHMPELEGLFGELSVRLCGRDGPLEGPDGSSA